MAKKTEPKTDIPAADDIIDGTSKTSKSASRNKKEPPVNSELSARKGTSQFFTFLSIGMSATALSWLAYVEFNRYSSDVSSLEQSKAEWQIARDADRQSTQTEFDAIRADLSKIESRFAPISEHVKRLDIQLDKQLAMQSNEADTAEADNAQIQQELLDIRARLSVLEEQIEAMPAPPTKATIWFDGLKTASQFGQDLSFWKDSLDRLTTPSGGWSQQDTAILEALASVETASHQVLISAASTFIEAGQASLKAQEDSADSWFSWAGDFVRFGKIDTSQNNRLKPIYDSVATGDLQQVRDTVLESGIFTSEQAKSWLTRVDSRLQFDTVISTNAKQAGDS